MPFGGKNWVVLLLWLVPALASADPLERVVATAASRGLPVAALKNKILEGRTKKVPPARVRIVLEQFVAHMLDARKALRKGRRPVPPALLVAFAEACLAGLARTTVLQVVSPGGRPGDVRRVDALVTLNLRGYSGPATVRLVKITPQGQLPRLSRALEEVRLSTGLTRAEVQDSVLSRMQSQGSSLGKALGQVKQKHGQKGTSAKPWKAPKVKKPKKPKKVKKTR